MNPLDLVTLTALMEITQGRTEIRIGLIDGPVARDHPDLADATVQDVSGSGRGTCTRADSLACQHGTFVAGMLCARRGSPAPAICPGCTLLVRSIFSEADEAGNPMPSATPDELAAAVIECVDAGAQVLNMSVGLTHPTSKQERALEEAFGYAAVRGVLVVVAVGNQGVVGSSAITRHSWVIPVVACDSQARPTSQSNLGTSTGRRGLRAPGDAVTSLGTAGQPITSGGSSVAAPFVTGALALLLSQFPMATTAQVKWAITEDAVPRRATIVPPLLDAWAAHQSLAAAYPRR